MGVVAGRRLVLDMRRRNGDAARLLFGRRIDLVIRLVFAKILGDRRRQRRLAMVDMANRADVHMRLRTLEFTFCHCSFLGGGTQLHFECGAISDCGRKTQASFGRGVLWPGAFSPSLNPSIRFRGFARIWGTNETELESPQARFARKYLGIQRRIAPKRPVQRAGLGSSRTMPMASQTATVREPDHDAFRSLAHPRRSTAMICLTRLSR